MASAVDSSSGRTLAIVMMLFAAASVGLGDDADTLLIADMEKPPAFTAEGKESQPKVEITELTASQGKRSLRFEHSGTGPMRAKLSFPVDGAQGFDGIAFDLYCEHDMAFTKLRVLLGQEFEGRKEGKNVFGFFDGLLNLRDFIDGWTPVRLGVDAGLKFTPVRGAKADWGRIRSVEFMLYEGNGRTVLYLDNIRFIKTRAGETSNLLYNSSFEITTVADVPDGWGRSLSVPPFGDEVWALDATAAFHGAKSLRIGLPGKYARSWIKHLSANPGKDYVFSVYLKGNQEPTEATLQIMGARSARKTVTVGKEWQRYCVGGTGTHGNLYALVTLDKGGALWLDAAQLEIGTTPTAYAPSRVDILETQGRDSAEAASKGLVVAVANPVTARWDRVGKPSAIEGRISNEPMLDLIGTEFDFYTREAEARARCFINAVPQRCRGLGLRWWIEQDGRPIVAAADMPLAPGRNEWTIPLSGLVAGNYLLKTALLEKGASLSEAAKPLRKLAPAGHEVRINQWGRFLVCDGKPLFWYGFYDAIYHGTDQRWADALKDMKTIHATAVLIYTHMDILDADRIRRSLDAAAAQDMKVWVHLSWLFSFRSPKYAKNPKLWKSEEEARAALRDVIRTHRDHPALLGWCTLDEPGNRPTVYTKQYTQEIYRLVKELDPYHPCIFSHLTRLGDYDVYGAAADLALIPMHAERDPRAEQLFGEFWDRGLPIATNAQCYGAISGPREPTPQEIRVRIYKPVILGARGFCSYTYRGASMLTWRERTRIGDEFQTLGPILLSSDDRLRVELAPSGRDVLALLKAHAGKYYLLAVNTSPGPVAAAFCLVDVPTLREARSMFAAPAPSVDCVTKTLRVAMPAKSTAVYEIEP